MSRILPLAVLSTIPVVGEIPRPDDAPRPLDPEESRECFVLPEGFRIELVASEPLVADPSCVAWDEHGRLFVTEIHGYNLEGHLDVTALNQTGKLDTEIRRVRVGPERKAEARRGQTGTLKLLKDHDGDGRMDEAITWADDIPAAYGVVAARGGVIVTAAPHILYLADTDGDDLPDVRETLFTGFEPGEMERAINNPTWGPDNWIYIGRGWGGGTITGPRLAEPVRLGRSDFRIRADGSAIEPVSGENHTFGMAFDEAGHRWLITTSQHARYALPLPHRFLVRNPHVPTPGTTVGASSYGNTFPASQPHPWRRKRGADPRWVKFYGAGEAQPNGNFTSACGQRVYRAGLFPPEFEGNHFACDPQQNMVHRSIIHRDGPGLRVERATEGREFLASTDGWFRPTNLRVGPDGALYVVDMYREIIEDYSAIPRALQQQYGLLNGDDRGRIWRLLPRGAHRAMELATLGKVATLLHADAWFRRHTQRLIVERGQCDDLAALKALVREGTVPARSRVPALYTLRGLGELGPEELLAALRADDHPVRVHALRLVGPWLNRDLEIRKQVVGMVDTERDSSVLLQLAMSLGEGTDEVITNKLAELAERHGTVRWMEAAILSSLAGDPVGFLERVLANHPGTSANIIERAAETAVKCGGKEALVPLFGALAQHPDRALALRTIALAARHGIEVGPELRRAADQALKLAADRTRPSSERLAAYRLATHASPEVLRPALEVLVDESEDPVFRERVVRELAASYDEEWSALLIELLPRATPRVAGAITEGLLSHPPAVKQLLASEAGSSQAFSSLQRHRLLHHEEAEIRRAATALMEASVARPTGTQAAHYAALSKTGDPERGRELYKIHCALCHRFAGEGRVVGPSLDAEAGRPAASLLGDILDPGATLAAGYETWLATTRDGTSHIGVLAAESATSVTLVRADASRVDLLRRDLATLRREPLSLMPPTFAELLSPTDAADLVSWLKSRSPPPSVVLFEDDPAFPVALEDGKGEAALDWRDAASGQASLTVKGFQRYARQLPGWTFPIREAPASGEFRYLQIAIRSRGSEGVMLELADRGSFPPEDRALRTYYVGRNSTGWASNELAAEAPAEWKTFTIDLWKGNGDFVLTGLALTVMGGEASYDAIRLFQGDPEGR